MSETTENKKAICKWIVAITISAGLGSAIIDFDKHLYFEDTKSEAKPKFNSQLCQTYSGKLRCRYYFLNKGGG